jgi:hypothetical protein
MLTGGVFEPREPGVVDGVEQFSVMDCSEQVAVKQNHPTLAALLATRDSAQPAMEHL